MKIRFREDHQHITREKRMQDLVARMKTKFPGTFNEATLPDPRSMDGPGLFMFCDVICEEIPPADAAPLMKLADVPLIRIGCNDTKWSAAVLKELDRIDRIYEVPYMESVSYASYYHPERCGAFFSALEIAYGFYHAVWQTDYQEMQGKIRELVSRNAVNGFKKERIPHYGVSWIMIENSYLYTFHNDATVILDASGSKSAEVVQRAPVYMDAPLGFCISYRGRPDAVISFWPDSENTLLIHQLQGLSKKLRGHVLVRDYARGLNDLDWKAVMMGFAAWVAEKAGLNLGILGAKNNQWIKPDTIGKFHIDYEKAVQRYDRLAESYGMQKAENGNYYQL